MVDSQVRINRVVDNQVRIIRDKQGGERKAITKPSA